MISQPIRPNLARMPELPAEPSVAEHLFLLAGLYKKHDGTIDREAFSTAMEKNEWLKRRTTADQVKGHIETACFLVENNFPENASGALSLRLG